MNDFDFHAPSSVDEAVALLRSNGGARPLGGGQSLLPLMKLGMAEPPGLVSLAGIPGLDGIEEEDGGRTLRIGAAATHDRVHRSEAVRRAIPALAELAGGIGDPQVRNRGTLGGSVAHNDPAADYPAALLGLAATVVTDRREIAADDFLLGMFTTPLEEDELVVAVRFPVPDRAAYAKFENSASKYAVAGVFVAGGPSGVRVAVTGAGPGAFRVPEMEEALTRAWSPDALEGIGIDAADLLADEAGSAEYRAHLVGVMARRAVEACS